MATYSREYLQSYRQNFRTIQFCNQIVDYVLQKAQQGETRYVYPMKSKQYPIGNCEYVNAENMIFILKERLLGCLVEYQEIKNINGKVESGIVVDWS